MKKYLLPLTAASLIILLIALFVFPAPQGKLIFSRPFYKDGGLAVYHTGNQHLVIKKGEKAGQLAIPSGESIENVVMMMNKAALEPPLYGVQIAEGIIITGPREIHIVRCAPGLELLASCPNPGTKGDKIIIDKQKNMLYLYKSGELYKSYPVATGKDPSFTPEGHFIVKNKLGEDDLNEQLGVRWLGLGVPDENDNRAWVDERAPEGLKYGIHGTDEPESIGKHASGGCIRMNNEDVRELYPLVQAGTVVEITGRITPAAATIRYFIEHYLIFTSKKFFINRVT